MNLLERIDSRLSSRARINPHDFEDCACALLGAIHEGLVPITGGTDHGLDAEIVRPNGDVVGLIVTSSRSWDGARKSVRSSLRSARVHNRPVHQILVANLAEMNRQRRDKLSAIAGEFDCELLQVYDRAWFANAFRADPEWRQQILGVRGGIFCLSREPLGARPGDRELSTVGRDQLLEQIDETDRDVVLFGAPGSGKSHVGSRLPSALFLEPHAGEVQLLDDIISAKPSIVVVDDAGTRVRDLIALRQARRAEGLGFRILATCWPHEADAVGDLLPDSVRLEVDLLTRAEIGALLRERGITRTSVLARILEQAQGRPAWALNLADLLVRDGDWRAVWTGRALTEEIRAFLRRSNASPEALELLSAIALVGEVNESQARSLAELFQLRPVEFSELIRSIAISGLVDVRRVQLRDQNSGEVWAEDAYRVVPSVIAASVVSDVYFAGRATAVRVRDIQAALPELRPSIIQTRIYSKLIGAAEPNVPSPAEVRAALASADLSSSTNELLRSYALVDADCANFVLQYLTEEVGAATLNGDQTAAEGALKILAARVAERLEESGPAPVEGLFTCLVELEGRGWDIATSVKELVEEAQDARSGDTPTPDAILKLARTLGGHEAQTLTTAAWAQLVAEVLQPTFDGNYMSPENPRQFVLQSFTWPSEVMDEMFMAIDNELTTRADQFTDAELRLFIKVLDTWVGIAKGYGLRFDGSPSEQQMVSAERISTSLAGTLAARISSPGLRTSFNRIASKVGVALDEPDPLFAALSRERDYQEDWQETLRVREAALDAALAPYLHQPPNVLMAWIIDNEGDLADVANGTSAWRIMQRVSTQPDPDRWLHAAMAAGLAYACEPLIRRCIELDRLLESSTTELLADSSGRHPVISVVLSGDAPTGLVSKVVDDLGVDDLGRLDSAYALRSSPAATRHALFTHPDPLVRSNAAAIWAAEHAYDAEGLPDDDAWLDAIADLVVPASCLQAHTQSTALELLAVNAPSRFSDLLAQHVSEQTRYDDFDEWEDSLRKLPIAARDDLWNRVQASPMAHNLFWMIAAGDTDWILATVGRPDFPLAAHRLLRAMRFQFGIRYPLKTLAAMLRPLDPEPEELLWTLEVGTFTGEEHERLAQHLQECRDLEASPDADLARLGRRGVEIYGPRLAEARAAARRADVRGQLGY